MANQAAAHDNDRIIYYKNKGITQFPSDFWEAFSEGTISIIVPIYNREKFLNNSIACLLNQTYSNLQIILVDDGSTDSSGEICDQFAKEDSRVIIIHKPNGGVSSARNVGLSYVKGEYIGFFDSDDLIELTMFEKLLSHLKEKNGMCVMCERDIWKNGKQARKICFTEGKEFAAADECCDNLCPKLNFSPIAEKHIGCIWDKLYKRELWEKHKFDEELSVAEDRWALFEMFFYKLDTIFLCHEIFYHYQIHDAQISSKKARDIECDYTVANRMLKTAATKSKKLDPYYTALIKFTVLRARKAVEDNNNERYIETVKEFRSVYPKVRHIVNNSEPKFRLFLYTLRYSPILFKILVHFVNKGRKKAE